MSTEQIRANLRTIAWVFAWALPLTILIVGIAMTGVGNVSESIFLGSEDGYDNYESYTVAVWPAGLVLLGVGALGVIAVALAAAIVARANTAVALAAEEASVCSPLTHGGGETREPTRLER